MLKNPVYGYEKPYLELICKELLIYSDEAVFDEFSNLLISKNDAANRLIAFAASENAVLINEILSDGTIKFSPLFQLPETHVNERMLSNNNKSAFIDVKNNILDFGVSDEKSAQRIAKPGDVLYLRAFTDTLGEYYITNEPAFFLKTIMTDFLKTTPANATVAFLREKNKGGYALGKNKTFSQAYFLAVAEDLPYDVCFLKKEGDFVSPMEISALPTAVLKDAVTQANSYFLAGGGTQIAPIGIKAKKLPNGQYKIKKDAVSRLFDFFGQM